MSQYLNTITYAFVTGEKRPGRVVIATSNVKCLLVPVAFLTKHNASNIWGRTVCSLDGSDPTAEQSFRKFVVENRWEEYKKSLAEEILGKRCEPSSSSSISRRWLQVTSGPAGRVGLCHYHKSAILFLILFTEMNVKMYIISIPL